MGKEDLFKLRKLRENYIFKPMRKESSEFNKDMNTFNNFIAKEKGARR